MTLQSPSRLGGRQPPFDVRARRVDDRPGVVQPRRAMVLVVGGCVHGLAVVWACHEVAMSQQPRTTAAVTTTTRSAAGIHRQADGTEGGTSRVRPSRAWCHGTGWSGPCSLAIGCGRLVVAVRLAGAGLGSARIEAEGWVDVGHQGGVGRDPEHPALQAQQQVVQASGSFRWRPARSPRPATGCRPTHLRTRPPSPAGRRGRCSTGPRRP